MATRLKLQYLGVEWRLEKRGMEWRLGERATENRGQEGGRLMWEAPGRGKRWEWRRRSGVRPGSITEAVSVKGKERETRMKLLESAMECHWREKDSTETSCDRKRRFSGSHSRHPFSRLRQPPPFDVSLFHSFRPADSSRVPLLVNRATG